MEGLKNEVTRRIYVADQKENQVTGLERENASTAITKGHYGRDCLERNKGQDNTKNNGDLAIAQEDYESTEVL